MKTGLSPLYDIEMLIKKIVFLEFCVFLDVHVAKATKPNLFLVFSLIYIYISSSSIKQIFNKTNI